MQLSLYSYGTEDKWLHVSRPEKAGRQNSPVAKVDAKAKDRTANFTNTLA